MGANGQWPSATEAIGRSRRTYGVVYALHEPAEPPAASTIRYVGRSAALAARLRDHQKGRRGGIALREWLGALVEPPYVSVQWACKDADELERRERQTIAKLRAMGVPLLNVGQGGSSNSYDPARRRKGKRSGRDRGAWIYIPEEELVAAGFAPDGEKPCPLPFYRLRGYQRSQNARAVVVDLYTEP